MQTLLANAKIYDGSGAQPYQGDILLKDERIIEVAEHIEAPDAKFIDLGGLSISSGFFDAHSHNDWFATKTDHVKYMEPFVRQGFTSCITGNCGISSSGYDKNSPYKEKVGAGLFHNSGQSGEYASMDEFFNAIERNTPLNTAALIGHCTVRTSLAGYENRPLTAEEMKTFETMLQDGLDQGACGISLGLMYEPGLYAPSEELKKVVNICEKNNKPMTVHPRAESKVSMAYPEIIGRSHLLRALDELEELTCGTHVKLQYSHLIFVGKQSFNDKDEVLRIFERMREAGVDVMFDLYAEVLGVSVITIIMPGWYQVMNTQEKHKFFNKLKFSILANASIMLLGFGFKDITIAYAGEGNQQFEGKTVHQIARELGKSDIDTYLYLCEISNFQGRVNMGPYSTPEIISYLSKDEHVLYMTDAWMEDHGVQNPALYDCFPKFLQLSLQGSGDSMPRTIRKMTGAVADRFSIKERGYIRPGYFADLTVFDEEKLRAGVPDQFKAFGIEKVFINGQLVLDGEALDRKAFAHSGHALRV